LLNKPPDPSRREHNPHAIDDEREHYARALEEIGGEAGEAPAQNVYVNFRDRRIFDGERPWFSLRFSADGKQLMAHRGDALLIWDRSLGAGRDYVWFRIPNGVRRAAIHPNGKEAVVADVVGRLAHYQIRSRDKLGTLGQLPEKVVPVEPLELWQQLAYSPDGQILAVIRGDALELYDVTDPHRVPWPRLTHLRELPTKVNSVIFSADSQTIALLDDTKLAGAPPLSDGAWWLFDMKTGKLRQRLPAGHITGNQSALSPDARLLAVNSNAVGRKVYVWNTEDGKTASVAGDEEGAGIESLAFVSPNLLAIGTANGALALWNARTGKKLRDLPWHTSRIRALALSPDGTTLASADERGWVKLWDLREGVEGE
jgi:WD40 repeat protein